MANVAHSSLTGSNLHETKGMASATDDYVLTATSGAGVYKKLTHVNLTTTGNPFGAQLFHTRHAPSSGTGSDSLISGSWNTRTIGTSVTNEITSASLASNQLTLPAGTYFIQGWATLYTSTGATIGKIRLRNITGSATLLVGTNIYLASGSSNIASSGIQCIQGRFTLAGSTVCELQNYVTSSCAGGTPISSGEIENYVDLCVWKVS